MVVPKFKVALGIHVKDALTGFNGHVTGRSQYMTGCNQYLVQAKCKKGKNEYPESAWLDENRLIRTKTKPITLTMPKKKKERGACGVAPIK